ncbi:YqaA family protein [Stappia sp. ES.058]|uniref:YqaA family protein n=1 Tax=Stappia sp. ES.058 TaxID=1881061 RepID=UPI00087B34BA|nr:YqaA family protein [Stappia sp. ES.058]SDU12721.1 membrane protein YqaA, SNARE-associated domain [Stappia sp. ES.058]
MILMGSLFLGAFLAATLLPFSSEVMLIAALAAGDFPPSVVVATATAGNILGSALNWLVGRFLLSWQEHRWFPFTPAQIESASVRFSRYGSWSLLFAFLPVVGDPLTFAAGLLKVPFWRFLILVSIGKTARYAALAAAM